MKFAMAAAAALLVAASAANASTAHVNYDPNAPESNFGAPTNANKETAYDITSSVSGDNLIVDVKASGGHDLSAFNFANVYLGGASFSPGLIFEVTNDRVSTTSDPSHYYSLAGTGFSFTDTGTAADGDLDISFSLPFSFLETDPLGIGFTKVTPGERLRISYAQAFGYSFVGGDVYYPGGDRLGGFNVPTSAAPEPATWALMMAGVGLAGGALRRRRAAGLAAA